jgi:hypothetical protein
MEETSESYVVKLDDGRILSSRNVVFARATAEKEASIETASQVETVIAPSPRRSPRLHRCPVLQSLKVSEVHNDHPDLAQALDGPEKEKWAEAISLGGGESGRGGVLLILVIQPG